MVEPVKLGYGAKIMNGEVDRILKNGYAIHMLHLEIKYIKEIIK